MAIQLLQADASHLPLADGSVDLVFGSPPYCDARTYGIGIRMRAPEWVDWMLTCTHEAMRVSRGLVVWVCAGVTRKHCYWPAPEGLLWEWFKAGGHCFRPAYWFRHGVPGSGGKQGLANKIEYCLMFKRPGRLPFADPLAYGTKPKYAPGGEMANRLRDGTRVNQWGGRSAGKGGGSMNGRTKHGKKVPGKDKPSHEFAEVGKDGKLKGHGYSVPKLANPGNLLRYKVGGGALGNDLAHENEAPFPERLAEFFIRSYCPPDGTVLDPFCGSGTTLATAARCRRSAIGCDIRDSQVDLSWRRCQDIPVDLF